MADLPPLAALIAKSAGLPCWMIGNFGWDFIYRDWGEEFASISDWISRCYNQCDRLFKLPLAEAMTAFPHVTEAGLTGGTPRYSEEQLRQEFKLNAPKEKTILLSFGGLGLEAIPYNNLASFPDWQFITFESSTKFYPPLSGIIKSRRIRSKLSVFTRSIACLTLLLIWKNVEKFFGIFITNLKLPFIKSLVA